MQSAASLSGVHQRERYQILRNRNTLIRDRRNPVQLATSAADNHFSVADPTVKKAPAGGGTLMSATAAFTLMPSFQCESTFHTSRRCASCMISKRIQLVNRRQINLSAVALLLKTLSHFNTALVEFRTATPVGCICSHKFLTSTYCCCQTCFQYGILDRVTPVEIHPQDGRH